MFLGTQLNSQTIIKPQVKLVVKDMGEFFYPLLIGLNWIVLYYLKKAYH